MKTEVPGSQLSVLAAVALSKGIFVMADGNICEANHKALGVCGLDTGAGEYAPIDTNGIRLVLSGAAITVTDEPVAVISDAAGKAIEATGISQNINGYALDSATGADQWIRVLVVHAVSNAFDNLTASYAELNILDGATVTAAELNLLDLSAQTETITEAGAVSVTKRITKIEESAGDYAVTLAAPDASMLGQVKVIAMTARATHAVTMALTNVVGGSNSSSASFDAVGETLILVAGVSKWIVVKEYGVTLS